MFCDKINQKAIVLVRGNDTNFNDANFLTIYLNTEILDLSTFKAVFKLGSITRTFNDISSGKIELNFTAAETTKMLPECYGSLNLIDNSNRIATIESLIPFKVISTIDGNAIATEPYTLNFDVKQGGENILNVSVESAVTVSVGSTVTLPAGSNATVTNVGTGNHLILNFGIPKGVDGGIISVNGQTGIVELDYSDVNALSAQTTIYDLTTETQRAAINSGANTENIGQISTNTTNIALKQDIINDLTTIRSGAALGATSLQPNDNISELTNNAGYITSSALSGYATETWVGNQGYLTGITSSNVTTALGYTPYDSNNPSGYTSNVGTVVSVNNTSPDSNGNVTLSIPTVDQTYDATSPNAQSGVAIAGAGFLTLNTLTNIDGGNA